MESETGVLRARKNRIERIHATEIGNNVQLYPTREWKHGDPGESNAKVWKR